MPVRRSAKPGLRPTAAVADVAGPELAHDLGLDLVRVAGTLSATPAIVAEIEREADAALRALKSQV